MNPEELQRYLKNAQRLLASKQSTVGEINNWLRRKGAPAYGKLVDMAKSGEWNVTPERVDRGVSTSDLLLSAGQGATMNWLDRFIAANAAAGAVDANPEGDAAGRFVDTYNRVRNNVRDRHAIFAGQHPALNATFGLGGAAVPALATGGLFGPAPGVGMGTRVATTTGAGALFGAGAGAGASENASDMPVNALEGGVAGGLFGAGAGLAAEAAAGPGASFLTRAAALPALGAGVGAAAAPEDQRLGGAAIGAGVGALPVLVEGAGMAMAPEAMGARSGNAMVSDAARSMGLDVPAFAQDVNANLAAKFRQSAIGSGPPAEAAKILTQRRLDVLGKRLFGPLDVQYKVLADPRLDAITEQSGISRLWRAVRARRKAPPGFADYQALRQRLGAEADRLKTAAEKSGSATKLEANDVLAVRDQLTDVLNDIVPGFRAANLRFSNTAATVDAFGMGAEAIKKGFTGARVGQDLVMLARKAGPEAQDAVAAYRHGAVDEYVRTKMLDVKRTANVGREMSRMGKNQREVIRALFESPQEFEAFLREAEKAGQLSAMQANVLKAAAPVAAEGGEGGVLKRAFAPGAAFEASRAAAVEQALRTGAVSPGAFQLPPWMAVPDMSAAAVGPVSAAPVPDILDLLKQGRL